MHPEIRVRAALAVVENDHILLVPHFQTGAGAVQWTIPGGKVDFGECLQAAAVREFLEETGLHAVIIGLLDTSEVILPDQPYHSITITFLGRVTGGDTRPEANHPYGTKVPRWMNAEELQGTAYHPAQVIEKALSKGITG